MPQEIRFLRKYLGLSSKDFASKIGVDWIWTVTHSFGPNPDSSITTAAPNDGVESLSTRSAGRVSNTVPVGTAIGTATVEGADAGPAPTAFTAVTRKTYAVPFARPDTTVDSELELPSGNVDHVKASVETSTL